MNGSNGRIQTVLPRLGIVAVVAVFVLGFAPLAMLFTVSPSAIRLWACYLLAAVCAALATALLRLPAVADIMLSARGLGRVPAPSPVNATHASDLPGREALLSFLAKAKAFHTGPALLGVIRIANYDRMCAFDLAMADRLLRTFEERLSGALGKANSLAKVERNCFAIWFGGQGSADSARAELQVLSYALTQHVYDDQCSIEPVLEVGSAEAGASAETPQQLLSLALASLAKPMGGRTASGGVQQVFIDQRRRFALEQDLRRAIGNGELELHYQPFICTASGRVTGAEALLRWTHPKLGAVSPLEFVPILEESGLIHDAGHWVFNTACRQLREWRIAGQTDFRMAVNLSAKQLHDPSLKTFIERTIQNHKLAPDAIEFELTETAAMEDSESTLKLFRALRASGFGLAIDDFGSGYSSLSYLKNLPFSKLKIDREFITRVDQRSGSRAICKALLELTSGLGLTVLAEGVERREEVEVLHQMGCTQFQGFYFARGMNAVSFAQTVSDPAWLGRVSASAPTVQTNLKARRL